MYELHVPLVVLSNRALQRGPQSGADPKEIKKDLKVKATYDKRQQQIIVSKILVLNSSYNLTAIYRIIFSRLVFSI